MYWSLYQIEGLFCASRYIQVALSSICFSVLIISDDVDDNVLERYQCISQEENLCSLIYEVGNILDGFLM